MNPNEDWAGKIAAYLLVAFIGLSAGSGWLGRRDDGASAPSIATSRNDAPIVAKTGSAESGRELIRPRGADRALALIADALSPDALFTPDESGGLALSIPWTYPDDAASAWDENRLVPRVKRLADREGASVQFVIATLPDWIDSADKRQFDPSLAAIQSAMSAVGYVPDSFYIPLANEGSARKDTLGDGSRLKAQEAEIGAVLFRKTQDTSSRLAADLALVMLVGETATHGVHGDAFRKAARLVAEWEGEGAITKPVRVLGPFYSGSAYSLAASMRSVCDDWRSRCRPAPEPPPFALVSGSATSPENRSRLTKGNLAGFNATVRSDNAMQGAMAAYLGRIEPGWRCGQGVAMLVESTTGWGTEVGSRGANTDPKWPEADASSDRTIDTACHACRVDGALGPPYFPCALQIPFPMHISRLRSEFSKAPKPQLKVVIPTSSTVALQLDERESPSDRLPPITSELTAAGVDTILSEVFQTLQDSKVRAVGIYATDKRDHVFLAQEMARRAPDLLPFAIESDLIYLHPDARSYLRGTLVASTYALYDRTQILTGGFKAEYRRIQFPNVAAEGIYNATLYQLDRPDLMLDYATPAGAHAPPRLRPPVWISEVGRDALFPLAADDVSEADDYSIELSKPPESATGARPAIPAARPRYLHLGPRTWALVIVLGLLGAGFVALPVAMILGRPEAPGGILGRIVPRLENAPIYRRREFEQELRVSLFACAASVTAVLMMTLRLNSVFFADRYSWFARHGASISDAATIGLYWLLVGAAAWSFWGVAGERARRRLAGWAIVGAYGCFVMRWTALHVATTEAAFVRSSGSTLRVWACATTIVGVFSVFADIGIKLPPAARWRRVPVLFGLAALAGLATFIRGADKDSLGWLLFFERASTFSSLVSPVAVVIFLATAIYAWGIWNVRRLWFIPSPSIGPDSLFHERTIAAGVHSDRDLLRPALSTGVWGILPATAVAVGWFVSQRHSATPDGGAFSVFLWAGSTCVLAVMAHSLAHAAHLGRSLLFTLRAVDRHPIGERFEDVGKERFAWRLSLRELRPFDLEPLSRAAARFAASVRALAAEPAPPLLAAVAGDHYPTTPQPDPRGYRRPRAHVSEMNLATGFEARTYARALQLGARDVQAVVDLPWHTGRDPKPAARTDPRSPFRSTSIWARLDRLARILACWLHRTAWRDNPETVGAKVAACRREAEYLVAFHLAVGVRDLLTRLAMGFTVAVGGLLLLMCAHLFYSFQGRPVWLAVDWVAIGVGSVVAVAILIGLEKNAVLSRLWGTRPGSISLTSGLSWRMAFFVLVTVLSLFVSFFPEVGGSLASWLDPVSKSIP